MSYVFEFTEGEAQKILDPLYLSDSPMAFRTMEDMITHLANSFEELDTKADAQDQYSALRQQPQERFRAFRVRFLHLANQAGVALDTQLNDIFRKSHWDLQERLLSDRRR